MTHKKAFIVTYYWYPFTGVGTYRISRFIKYLLKSGWEVVILTPKKAAAGMTGDPDDPILNDCTVYRSNIIEPTSLISSSKESFSKSSNPSIFYQKNKNWKSKLAVWARLNLMIPDAKFTWKWFAVPLGKRIIKKENPSIILSTSPPPTTNLIAQKLANWSGLPWLADFRDPWTNIYYYDDHPQSSWARKKNKELETKTLQQADRVTLVNNGFFPDQEEFIADKTEVISNGFDPDHIIKAENSSKKNSKFTIRYFGSLKANQYPTAFIKALTQIKEKQPKKAQNLKFEFFGSIEPEIMQELKTLAPDIELQFTGFIPHEEMMKLVQSADLLLLIIGKTKNSKFVLSTKVFEYMTSGNPILGIGPLDGSAAKLVQEAGIGHFFSHNDSKGIQEFMHHVIDGELKLQPNQAVINEYDFRYLTRQLERIMDDLITS